MIFVTHGVISPYSRERISHALCLPTSRAALHLRLRHTKYVSVVDAIVGKGDALTIDDATQAGLELAFLARRYGHAVTWFVNGHHVENRIEYFPFQISCMLDDTRETGCRFDGDTWNLDTTGGRRTFRRHIKQLYMQMRKQHEITDLIDRLADSLHTDSTNPESSLRTVGTSALAQAVLAGVDLQNHGWSHLNPQMFSDKERADDVKQNDEYLAQFRRANTPVFAPPFGQPVILSSLARVMLLADRSLAPHYEDGSVINRGDLVLRRSAETPRDTGNRALELVA
jgi:peptidoglycan/xylan/chitin deacetylase (PgdA/CDA1 family)